MYEAFKCLLLSHVKHHISSFTANKVAFKRGFWCIQILPGGLKRENIGITQNELVHVDSLWRLITSLGYKTSLDKRQFLFVIPDFNKSDLLYHFVWYNKKTWNSWPFMWGLISLTVHACLKAHYHDTMKQCPLLTEIMK